MYDTFSGKIINSIYTFYKNNQVIGFVNFYIEYNQVTITWLNIKDQPELKHKGFGSKMLRMFIQYITKNRKNVSMIVLIPNKFDGNNRIWLCDFYEKNGFIQESKGYPFYIMKI
jgi:ribosomal protein S18 acetylase RimI-like enzyme